METNNNTPHTPRYVGIYRMTPDGETMMQRGKKFYELQEGKHYTLFTVLTYDEFLKYTSEKTIEQIIRKHLR